jgi:formamidopyrimidine-DNA glycosylase
VPELPEVETIRRELAPELQGRRIERLSVRKPDILLGPRTARAFRRRVEGRLVSGVSRRAKYLLFHLEGGHLMQVQLRMSGRFALGERLPDPGEFKHIVAQFALDDGRTLFYDDVRRLGGFRMLSGAEWRRLEANLGPEPLEPGFTGARLREALAGRRAPVKNVLMDQRRVAGVGNIYASEALHAARIDPRRPAGELAAPELRRLHRSIRRILASALAQAGTTFRNYRAVNGRSGSFQSLLRVYGREGERCERCRSEIVRIVQAGRSTFYCATCQR